MTISDIKKVYLKKGYELFEDDSKPFNLNLIGIRSADTTPNKFNDTILACWKYDGKWSMIQFKATTEAGLYYLNNPLNNKGTAILKEGRHPQIWSIGLHQGKYKALKQAKPCKVVRDFDRDSEHDFNSGVEELGIFGINLHRASASGESVLVDRWSAGCQVMANAHEFDLLMDIAEKSSETWGNSFTYVLLNENDFLNL